MEYTDAYIYNNIILTIKVGLAVCTVAAYITYILPPSHFFCPLFHFEMSQNIVLFLKIKVINLLTFLLYPY